MLTAMRLRDNQFLQAALVIAICYVLWRLRAVVLVLFVSFLVTTAVHPIVVWLKRHRFPTALAIILPILVAVVLLTGLLYVLLPPFLHRVAAFGAQLPSFLESVAHQFHLSLDTTRLSSYLNGHLNSISHYAFLITGKALKLLAAVVSVIVLSIYWLGSYQKVQTGILSLLRGAKRKRLEDIWHRIELKLQLWFKAHLMLNSAVGLMVLVAMVALRVPFAELLALLAFMVEIIPTAGPIIAGAPAVLLGLSHSLLKGLLVLLVYTVIQMIESHVLSPLLLGKTVQLPPILIITALLVGAEALGVVGALLAVPAALCISAIIDSYRNQPTRPNRR